VQQGELCCISRAGKDLLGNGLGKVVELLLTYFINSKMATSCRARSIAVVLVS